VLHFHFSNFVAVFFDKEMFLPVFTKTLSRIMSSAGWQKGEST